MSSTDRNDDVEEADRAVATIARRALEHAVRTGAPLELDPRELPESLRAVGATFVTIERRGDLLGCIGTLRPHASLAEDIAANAFGAVFRDPRCPPLAPDEGPALDVHVSILGPPERLEFDSEEDLLRQLRPFVDGLVLEDGRYRGTFLPVVWETLPEPRDFFAHLKRKAGLPATYWSDTLRVSRYTTHVVHAPATRSPRL